jgi:GMP synthase-like glutamine amidotransferase
MLLLLDNKKTKTDNMTYVDKIKNALQKMNIPFYETKKIEIIPENVRSKIKGIIISGSSMVLSGDLSFEEYAFNIHFLREFPDVPVYGICFGCQLLAVLYGYELKHGRKFCREVEVELKPKHKLFAELGNNKKQFHFCFTDMILPSSLENNEIAWFEFRNGRKMACAFEFEKGCVYGSIFHPEYLEETHRVLYNFAKMTKTVR